MQYNTGWGHVSIFSFNPRGAGVSSRTRFAGGGGKIFPPLLNPKRARRRGGGKGGSKTPKKHLWKSPKNSRKGQGSGQIEAKGQTRPFHFGCQLPAAEATIWAVRCSNLFKYWSYLPPSKVYDEIKVKVKVIVRSSEVTGRKTQIYVMRHIFYRLFDM